ncbi:AI-2E family transporter [Halobacillus sp. Marseille-Q1614]|uniref:AI-2E family transporter n=1 Tax=Halobacillus sp. Marseille-Q1614 TaxID=2709134 RepID=UPI0015705503|nr:AI-2E family transporter [Halobacillus sp. Marseille-Q1614]
MWWTHSFFKYTTGLILLLISIFFLEVLNFFSPVLTILSTLFYPILIAGFFYYIFKPAVFLIQKIKFVPKPAAILIVFAAVAGLIYGGVKLIANTLSGQVERLSTSLPEDLSKTADQAEKMIEENNLGLFSFESLRQKAASSLSDFVQSAGDHVTEVAAAAASAATVIVVVPFVLFFLLKDGHKLSDFLIRFLPEQHEQKGLDLLSNIDKTLGAYIIGQITVAFADGVLMYFGYLIIGLDYALLLAIFVFITAVIPFFGPILGVIPALIVSLTQEPNMAIYVLIVMGIVQQLEGNLIAPVVLGNRLNVHPLTIILLLIVAAALFGFIGMVIAVPLYSVLKVIVKNLYSFLLLRKSSIY